MQLSTGAIAHITRYLDLHADPAPADLAFVFGTRLPDPAHLAVEIVLQAMARYVVLTGGPNRLTGVNEARAHLDLLLERGVPRSLIIVEDASTNTLENVRFALPLVDAAIGLAQVRTIVVVAKWYHCRRAVMTLKRHMSPGVRYIPRTYAPNGIEPSNWHLGNEGRQAVLGNYTAIPTYLQRGHLADIEWDGDAFI
jgi:uncharacterized SAM-binding protein YcdF (DUF218 family)